MSKTNNEKTVTLNEGREKSLIRRHPWVFSKAVLKADEITFYVMDFTHQNLR